MVRVTPGRKARPGFTLMELAIIIAIVGILAAVGAVKYADMVTEAKKAGADSALANARSALAVAIAKDADGKVALADLGAQLSGYDGAGTGSTFKMKDGSNSTAYTVTYTGTSTDVTGVTSVVAN